MRGDLSLVSPGECMHRLIQRHNKGERMVMEGWKVGSMMFWVKHDILWMGTWVLLILTLFGSLKIKHP